MPKQKRNDRMKPSPTASPPEAGLSTGPYPNPLTEILVRLHNHKFAMGQALKETRLRSGARKAKGDLSLEKCLGFLKEPPLEERLGLIEKPALEEYLGIVKERTSEECSAFREEAIGLLEKFHQSEISLKELQRHDNPALARFCIRLCEEQDNKSQDGTSNPWDYAMQQIQERTVSLNGKVLKTYLDSLAIAMQFSPIVNEEKLRPETQRVADTMDMLYQDAAFVVQMLRGIWKEFQADAQSMKLREPDKIELNQTGACPANKTVPKGRDDFIGIAAWLWCCHNHDPQFYAGTLNPGIVCDYTQLLAIESGWSLHELFPLFWHCYKASQSNVRQYITCDLHDVDPEYVGRAADWLTQHHDSFDEEGRKLFEWLQDLHPGLSKELEAVIDSDRRESPHDIEVSTEADRPKADVEPARNDTGNEWPPDDGLHFRPLEFAYQGKVYRLTGMPHRLFEVIATAKKKLHRNEIVERVWTSQERTPEQVTVRSCLSDLKVKLRDHELGDLAKRIEVKDEYWSFLDD